jgi:hypothetical protein
LSAVAAAIGSGVAFDCATVGFDGSLAFGFGAGAAALTLSTEGFGAVASTGAATCTISLGGVALFGVLDRDRWRSRCSTTSTGGASIVD